jgi:hypothetical protein
MLIEKVGDALFAAEEFGLDGIDFKILQITMRKLQSGNEVTILSFTKFDFASFGTIHLRIQKLIDAGFLIKTVKPTNQRVKILTLGPRVNELQDVLNNLK